MKWRKWLENWDMTSLKIKTPFLEMEWEPKDEDKSAAWDLYIELLTRVTTQSLKLNQGNEASALESVHLLFPITREIIKNNGKDCISFTKIAIVILNQVIRPFTTKWHGLAGKGAFDDPAQCEKFRGELADLQRFLNNYTGLLASMAGVEDLTDFEDM